MNRFVKVGKDVDAPISGGATTKIKNSPCHLTSKPSSIRYSLSLLRKVRIEIPNNSAALVRLPSVATKVSKIAFFSISPKERIGESAATTIEADSRTTVAAVSLVSTPTAGAVAVNGSTTGGGTAAIRGVGAGGGFWTA